VSRGGDGGGSDEGSDSDELESRLEHWITPFIRFGAWQDWCCA
jgi:hypothetical protein